MSTTPPSRTADGAPSRPADEVADVPRTTRTPADATDAPAAHTPAPAPSAGPATAEPPGRGRWQAFVGSFAQYRELPPVAGRSYLVMAFLARLPITMVPVGVLTLATAATGSAAAAGLAAAAAAVGEAVGAPVSGAVADRRGQRPVLLVVAGLHALALVALLAAAASGDPTALAAGAALVGLTVPQVGPMSRARWLVMSPRNVRTAFAFEGTADEVGFALGPALVGVSAFFLGATAPVVVAAVLVVGLVTAFALHPSAAAVPARSAADRAALEERRKAEAAGRGFEPLVLVPLVGMLAIGAFFGASNVSLVATAADEGVEGLGALMAAAMAVGSAATALAVVALPASLGPWRRWAGSAVLLVVGAAAMHLASPSLLPLVLATVLAGLAVGPLLVTITDVAGRLAPEGGAGLAFTLLTSGVVLGVAGGSALAGLVGESAGTTAAFWVGVVAAVVLVLLVLVAAATRRPLPPHAG